MGEEAPRGDPKHLETSLAYKDNPRLWPYIQIARIDHWFKNAFMLLGVLVALFVEPSLWSWSSVPPLLLALLATCITASSNYVINETLDAASDVAPDPLDIAAEKAAALRAELEDERAKAEESAAAEAGDGDKTDDSAPAATPANPEGAN